MAKNRISGQDAIARVMMAKIPFVDSVGHEMQTLAYNVNVSNTTGVTSQEMGNPNVVRIFLTASGAATFAVWHSIDGVKFFHDATNDITTAGAGDKVADVKGAPFIRIIPTVAQTGCYISLIALYD